MPVNWAYPAAQGEPESFLTIPGSILLSQKALLAHGSLAAQFLLFAIVQSTLCSTCSMNFRIARLEKLSTPLRGLRPIDLLPREESY